MTENMTGTVTEIEGATMTTITDLTEGEIVRSPDEDPLPNRESPPPGHVMTDLGLSRDMNNVAVVDRTLQADVEDLHHVQGPRRRVEEMESTEKLHHHLRVFPS